MGYESSVQVIERANHTRQYYLICPAPLAQALEMEKGEIIEWVVEDKHTLIIKRVQRRAETSALKGKRRG
jgi:bifunctional DNA-binding transcriptional regulator/antitoxin component of YhaV-PrlF toxin-antitoxin module